MSIRRIVQRISAGLVLGGEAVGAIVLHESHSLALTAPAVILAMLATIWALDSGVNRCVKRWNWAANLLGVKPRSKVKIHGWWYSAIRDQGGKLLGGSVFRIQAGVEEVTLGGDSIDLTANQPKRTWWKGTGTPFGEDAIVYGYRGEEDEADDGFGMYSFPDDGGEPQRVQGSFYGKRLPRRERYRTANGERVPDSDITGDFAKNREARLSALRRYLDTLETVEPPAG